jgi:hypothetical protein
MAAGTSLAVKYVRCSRSGLLTLACSAGTDSVPPAATPTYALPRGGIPFTVLTQPVAADVVDVVEVGVLRAVPDTASAVGTAMEAAASAPITVKDRRARRFVEASWGRARWAGEAIRWACCGSLSSL